MTEFLNNKYTRAYYRLMEKAKSRPKPEGYTEKHHIIPESLEGREKVRLTFREHWHAHYLLTKMTEGPEKEKMLSAFISIALSGSPGRQTASTKTKRKIEFTRKRYLDNRYHIMR